MKRKSAHATDPAGLRLAVLPGVYGACRLHPKARIPRWVHDSPFYNITRTSDELSILCEQARVPNGVKCEQDWRLIQVLGTLDFSLIGVLASLANPLADAKVGLLTVSTFDTDYLMVRSSRLDDAIVALTAVGHRFEETSKEAEASETEDSPSAASEVPAALSQAPKPEFSHSAEKTSAEQPSPKKAEDTERPSDLAPLISFPGDEPEKAPTSQATEPVAAEPEPKTAQEPEPESEAKREPRRLTRRRGRIRSSAKRSADSAANKKRDEGPAPEAAPGSEAGAGAESKAQAAEDNQALAAATPLSSYQETAEPSAESKENLASAEALLSSSPADLLAGLPTEERDAFRIDWDESDDDQPQHAPSTPSTRQTSESAKTSGEIKAPRVIDATQGTTAQGPKHQEAKPQNLEEPVRDNATSPADIAPVQALGEDQDDGDNASGMFTGAIPQDPVETTEDTFESLGLSAPIIDTLSGIGFIHPTPIQAAVLPMALEGTDIVGLAETGSGKTGAFGLPLVERLRDGRGVRGLILCPTREIALQTKAFLDTFGRDHDLETAVVIGGVKFTPQINALRRHPDIIVATPGRLADHMRRGNVRLHTLEELVLDEADHMLDLGFLPQIQEILSQVPQNRRTMMFSATMPPPIERLAQRFLSDPYVVDLRPVNRVAAGIKHRLYLVDDGKQKECLIQLLKEVEETTLVFARRKLDTEWLARQIQLAKLPVERIHSDRSQAQRVRALRSFRESKIRILVATDVAARGIDVPQLGHVINFGLPETVEDYVHRAGRTARGKAVGIVSSVGTWQNKVMVKDIERVLGHEIERREVTGVSAYRELPRRRGRRRRLL